MAQKFPSKGSQTVKFHDKTIQVQTVFVYGIECLRLKDVQRIFPTVQLFSIDSIHQVFIHDDLGNDLEPLRIAACVGKVVEAFEPVVHTTRNNDGQLDRIEGKIDRIDENAQKILYQIRDVMRQMYELHEFTTPRYFFILPAKHSDMILLDTVQSWFQAHYKLYFLCECSSDPRDMHVAPHAGYSIKKTRDFIVKYAPYLRTTLQIAQVLLSTGGLVIPQLGSAVKIADAVIPSKLKNPKYDEDMKQQLKIVDNLLNKVDNQRNRPDTSIVEKQKSKGAPLQGAELREIQTYLERIDDKRTLGNLYRIVTDDGHVRWVCLRHYDDIAFHNEMRKYINDFEAMGGKFNEETREALVSILNVTSKNVQMMCNALGKGFNIIKLTLQDCTISEDDLEKLLDIVINRSSIRYLKMIDVRVRNFFGIKYTCAYMIIELNDQSLKIRFNDIYYDGIASILPKVLLQNKIYRLLNLSTCDFLRHELDFQRCLEVPGFVTQLVVENSNNVEILNAMFNLKTNVLNRLKLINSLCIPSTLSHFCDMLKKSKTLVEIDLMDASGFDDETFVTDLLDTLKDHKSITNLNLHVRNIRFSDQKEATLINSLRKQNFISRLCLSTSVISDEFINALVYALKEHKRLIHLEFYKCQINDDDKVRIESLEDNSSLLQLAFYEQARWDVMLKEKNEGFSRIIPNIPTNAHWSQKGTTVAGGNGYGSGTNQLYFPQGLFVDDDQTVIIADCFNHRIIQWKKNDTNGQVIAGGNGRGNQLDQLNCPTDILIDKETNSLIIADQRNRRVMRWSRLIGTTQGEILIDNIRCYGLALDDQRYLYVSDDEKHEVRRYKLDGDRNGIVVAGGNVQGERVNQLNTPRHLFVDQQQNVYVSDQRNNRVMKWTKGAKEGIVVAEDNGEGSSLTQFSYPHGLFVDNLGTLYIADYGNHRVIRWPQGATQDTIIVGGNGGGAGDNQFRHPTGLSFDRHGNLYVVDNENNRVQRFAIE